MTGSKWNSPEQSRARTDQQTHCLALSHGKRKPVGTHFPNPLSLQNQGPNGNVIVSTGWCQPLATTTPLLNSEASLTNAPKLNQQRNRLFQEGKRLYYECCAAAPLGSWALHKHSLSTTPTAARTQESMISSVLACSSLFSGWELVQRGWEKKVLTPTASLNERPACL